MLYIDATDHTMIERLVSRGKTSGRVDDNLETIKKRLDTFHKQTKPVIDYYQQQNKVHRISAENSPDLVFHEIEKIFDDIHPG